MLKWLALPQMTVHACGVHITTKKNTLIADIYTESVVLVKNGDGSDDMFVVIQDRKIHWCMLENDIKRAYPPSA